MQASAVVAAMLFVASCAAAPRDVELAGLKLNDRQVLQTLGEGVSERERGALATYALLHWPGSKAFCGHPVFAKERQPATVGEAIDLTIAFERNLEAKRAAEQNSSEPFEERVEEERRLVDEFDQLTFDRDRIETSVAGTREKSRRIRDLDDRIEANRRKRKELPFVSLR